MKLVSIHHLKNLVDAMNSNPNGTFRLGATMDAREVELPDGQES